MRRSRDPRRLPLSRLLIATDFSPGAKAALDRAMLLPLGPRPQLTLLHVLPRYGSTTLLARERAEAHRRLAAEAARVGGRVRTIVAEGRPGAEVARRSGATDLVILGRHGLRRFRDLLIGSTAERVVRLGGAPVLVVAGPPRRAYRRALVAVDRSPRGPAALDVAGRLLPRDAGALDLVHVYETPHDSVLRRAGSEREAAAYRRRCRAEAASAIKALVAGSPSESAIRALHLRRGEPRAVILATTRKHRADLLAVGGSELSPLAGTLLGSVSEGLLRHAPCDVLVVPAQSGR